MENISENVKKFKEELSKGNCFGEKVFLVAATKMQDAQTINCAIQAGVDAVGENWVQEFRDKYDFVKGAPKHFIGHLQTNKVKYLIGKTELYHSCDRIELAEEIDKRSQKANIVSNVLIQINIGCEESKGGFPYEEGFSAYQAIQKMPGIQVQGFMAMLPISEDKQYLISLVKKMRILYDKAKALDKNICYLSMGMSGDYSLCVEAGSNMVRIGTSIFGKRNYQ